MVSVTNESLDVSCRATAHTVQFFLIHNHPVSKLIEGIPHSLAHLENVAASISWDHYLRFLNNTRQILPDSQWHNLCDHYTDSPYLRSMLAAGGFWFSPNKYYLWALGSKGNIISKMFQSLTTNIVKMTHQEGIFEIQVREGYTLAPSCFWDAIALGIRGTTRLFGMPPYLSVEWEPIDRGARFTTRFSSHRSIFGYVKPFLASIFRRDHNQNLRVSQLYYESRERWLQEEIEKRQAIEIALRQSETQHRVLMEAAPEAILVYDLDQDRIITANRNAEVLLGQNQEHLKTMSIFTCVAFPESLSTPQALLAMVEENSGVNSYLHEFEFARPDGSVVPCEARLVRLPSESQTLLRVSITDISVRKQTEKELMRARDAAIETSQQLSQREQEVTAYANRLREAVELTNFGIFDHDHRANVIYRSPEILKIYGWLGGSSNDPYHFLQYIHEDDRETVLNDIQRSHNPSGRSHFRHTYRFKHPSGQLIWCEAQATTIFEETENGRVPLRTVGAVIDITDSVKREESLANSKRQLRAILESTSEGVFSLDVDLCYLTFNRHHFERMKEAYGTEISIGSCFLDHISVVRDRELAYANLKKALKGKRFVVDQQYGDSGRMRTSYEATFNPMKNDSGEVVGVAVFARDISQQLRSRDTLRELEEVQHLAIEASLLGVWKFSTYSHLFTLDERSQKLLAFDRAEVGEAEFESRIHPEDLVEVGDKLNQLNEAPAEGSVKINHRLLLPDGSCRWVRTCATRSSRTSIVDGSDEVWLIGTMADITEHEQTSLLLAASLQEKEAMLKEIHHRVKNNLQVISSLLSLQAFDFKNDQVEQFSLESQRRIRAMALVHEMLYQSESLAKIDMNEYVQRLCTNLIQSYGPEKANIVRFVDDLQLGLEQALPIGLILSELAANAFKHAFPSDSSGKGTGSTRGSQGTIQIELRRMLSGFTLLSVSDNGVGLPTEFDIESEKSLGLKLVHLLTRQIGGQLSVINAAGTTFTIEIPHEN